jgi:hypothetical protein
MNPTHKTIEHWSAKDIALYLEGHRAIPKTIIARLRELHDLTRWIPVSERMPTQEDYSEAGQIHLWDAEFGICRVYHKDIAHDFLKRIPLEFTHWQRITPPEGK